MTAEIAGERSSARPETTLIVVLLAVSVFINYVDRGNLATAAPMMKDELGLSNSQIGVLLSLSAEQHLGT